MAQQTAITAATTKLPAPCASQGRQHPADEPLLEKATTSHQRVRIDRLCTIATLTPAQAVYIAAQLLELPEIPASVILTSNGTLDHTPAPAHAHIPVEELLSQLVRSARRLPVHPSPQQASLLQRLEEIVGAVDKPASTRAQALESALVQTQGTCAATRVAAQLGALAEAFAQLEPDNPVHTGESRPDSRRPAKAGNPPEQPRPLTQGRMTHRAHVPARPHRRRGARPRHLALVVITIVTLLVGSAYVVERGPGAGIAEWLAGDSHAQASHSPSEPGAHAERPAQQPAPTRRQYVPKLPADHAGAITGVVLQRAGICQPGSLCPVKVTVHLRAASTPRQISWKVGAARLCRRGLAWSPPIDVTAQPGWTTVYAHSSVRVPRGRALALVATTTTPARARSGSVPVAGPRSC